MEFEDLLRHAILFDDMGYAGPIDTILSNVDVASLNLLGRYSAQGATRRGGRGHRPAAERVQTRH